MTTEHDLAEFQAVYLGRIATSSKKLAAMFIALSDFHPSTSADDTQEAASSFDIKPADLPRVIGGIYTIKGRKAKTIETLVTSGKAAPRFSGERVDAAELMATFEARDGAAAIAHRARKLSDQMSKDLKLHKLLSPLRQRYTSTDRIGRLALEVLVLDALRHT